MLIIKTGRDFEAEKRYSIDIVLSHFLGLEYTLEFVEGYKGYSVVLQNGATIGLNDNFFADVSRGQTYLDTNYLPKQVQLHKSSFTSENDLPVLFGNTELSVTESKQCHVNTGIDLFASVFFMLSRWEELVVKERDKFDRFPGWASIAYKNDFLQRSLVNEYVEWFWNLLRKAGYEGERKKTEYVPIPTHDVDRTSFPGGVIHLLGDIKSTKSVINPIKRIIYKLSSYNPYDTFSFLMDLSERRGVVSRFYFMSNGQHSLDNTYKLSDNDIQHIVSEVKKRGHIIGFHPGYETYTNASEWSRQYRHLCESVGLKPIEGRQHYLRMKMPDTLQIWNKAEMRIDSSLGYSDMAGFRCGTGNEFPLFDVKTRKRLELVERPLITMDTTLKSKAGSSIQKAEEAIYKLDAVCRKYKMPHTFLFHNSSFDDIRWKGWKKLYTDFMLCGA